jgi:hypothetical protein
VPGRALARAQHWSAQVRWAGGGGGRRALSALRPESGPPVAWSRLACAAAAREVAGSSIFSTSGLSLRLAHSSGVMPDACTIGSAPCSSRTLAIAAPVLPLLKVATQCSGVQPFLAFSFGSEPAPRSSSTTFGSLVSRQAQMRAVHPSMSRDSMLTSRCAHGRPQSAQPTHRHHALPRTDAGPRFLPGCWVKARPGTCSSRSRSVLVRCCQWRWLAATPCSSRLVRAPRAAVRRAAASI